MLLSVPKPSVPGTGAGQNQSRSTTRCSFILRTSARPREVVHTAASWNNPVPGSTERTKPSPSLSNIFHLEAKWDFMPTVVSVSYFYAFAFFVASKRNYRSVTSVAETDEWRFSVCAARQALDFTSAAQTAEQHRGLESKNADVLKTISPFLMRMYDSCGGRLPFLRRALQETSIKARTSSFAYSCPWTQIWEKLQGLIFRFLKDRTD